MRHSAEEKTKTHERIVEIASARIREEGIEGPGVAEIMQGVPASPAAASTSASGRETT